jgi:hypothetical protein
MTSPFVTKTEHLGRSSAPRSVPDADAARALPFPS